MTTNNTENKVETSANVYIHTFSKPWEYEGKTYTELTFDFGKLTGKDGLAVENEMQAMGKTFVTLEVTGEYLVRIAARACTENIGADIIAAMPLYDCSRIRNRTRNFLIGAL